MILIMNIYRLPFVLGVILLTSACGPMTAVGLVGNMVNKIADDYYYGSEQSTTRRPVTPTYDKQEIAQKNLALGIEYMRIGKYQLAMDKLNRARIAKPDYPPVYDALGLLHQKTGQAEEAEKYFLHSLKLNPDNSSTLNNYGQFLCNQDRLDEAEINFVTAAENPLYQTPEIPYANIGFCAYRNNQVDKANNFFQKALTLNPKMPTVLIKMSEISYGNGDYLSAKEYLTRYLSTSKHTPESLWLGIKIERELGDKNIESSYAMLLRNKYPDSSETLLLNNSVVNN